MNSISKNQSTHYDNKISLSKCKSILNKNGNKYTDEQIIQIRDYLYQIAKIDVEIFKRRNDSKMQ